MRDYALGGIINTKETAPVDNILASSPDYITRAATAIYVLGKYLLLLVLPLHLSIDYSAKEIMLITITDYRFLISFIILISLLMDK